MVRPLIPGYPDHLPVCWSEATLENPSSFQVLNSLRIIHHLPHGFPLQDNFVCIMDQTVQNCIGNSLLVSTLEKSSLKNSLIQEKA